MRTTFRVGTAVLAAALLGCTPQVYTGDGSPAPQQPATSWPVITRSHVDLWLHGYAMLLRDTSTVPVFRRGYREAVRAAKTQRSITTLLDSNRERLQSRLTLSPAIMNGQFLPLYFASFDQMHQVIDLFLRSDGGASGAPDRIMGQYFAVLAQSFPVAADREWLRLYMESLEDERRKFYQEYWTQEHGARIGHVYLRKQIRTPDSGVSGKWGQFPPPNGVEGGVRCAAAARGGWVIPINPQKIISCSSFS